MSEDGSLVSTIVKDVDESTTTGFMYVHPFGDEEVVVRRVVAWRWKVGGGDEGDATVGMVAAGGAVTAARWWRGWYVVGGHGDGDEVMR
ncbi:hypothetical protein Tco_1015353 [Tanacetum coccineum]|uniref:Uncharacterized protein n=1 Tax=Tanacetum coccineum TaxID=301880 RepID=A0ABQ5FLX3_9ASTR